MRPPASLRSGSSNPSVVEKAPGQPFSPNPPTVKAISPPACRSPSQTSTPHTNTHTPTHTHNTHTNTHTQTTHTHNTHTPTHTPTTHTPHQHTHLRGDGVDVCRTFTCHFRLGRRFFRRRLLSTRGSGGNRTAHVQIGFYK